MPVPSLPSLKGVDPKNPNALLGALAKLQKELTWLLQNLDEANVPALKNVRTHLPAVRVLRLTTQSISPSTWTTVTWDTEDFDDGGYWEPANPEYVTLTGPGKYLIMANVAFSTLYDERSRAAAIYVNGIQREMSTSYSVYNLPTVVSVSTVVNVGSGSHTASVRAYHNASSGLYLSDGVPSSLMVVKLA